MTSSGARPWASSSYCGTVPLAHNPAGTPSASSNYNTSLTLRGLRWLPTREMDSFPFLHRTLFERLEPLAPP